MKGSHIEISDLVLMCRLGVSSAERAHPQKIFVSCRIYANFNACISSDNIAHTFDYADVITTIEALIVAEHFNLIEHLAFKIRNVICDTYAVSDVDVCIRKPNAIREVRHVAFSFVS
jgi:dihydroneopterin aldolase